MTFRPSVNAHPPAGYCPSVWVVVAILFFWALAGTASAQDEGTWRLVVRQNVTRGEAERAIQNLPPNLPGLEIVPLPNGAFAVHMGRYPNEDEAQRDLERYFSQEGIRLGTVAFIPTATPIPATTPSPTPQATPSPTAPAPTPTFQPADPVGGMTSTAPAPPPDGGGELPWPLIIAVAAGLVVLGGGLYYFVLRKKESAPPAPAAVSRPPLPPVASRPKPSVAVKAAKPEPAPKPAPKPEPAPEPEPAPPAIRVQAAAPEVRPEAEKAPIAMPEAPQTDPSPSIILNDIFTDEPDAPGSATPFVDEGPRLDFLIDEGPRTSSPAGNGSSETGDDGLGVPPSFARGGAASAGSGSESPASRATPTAPTGADALLFELDLTRATPGQPAPGWSGSYDYAKLTVATEENGSGTPHLRFEKETGIGSAYYSCRFPDAYGRLAVDFEIRCDDKNKYLLGFYIEKDQDFRQSVHALIHRTNAKASPVLRLQNESVPYEFGTWRKVRYEIDLVRHLIDGFVDGEPVIVGQRVTSCPDGLNTLSIRDNLATTGVLLLRGVRIMSMD